MCNFDDIHEIQKASVLYCDKRNLVDLTAMFIILRQATEPNVWLRYRAAFRKWENKKGCPRDEVPVGHFKIFSTETVTTEDEQTVLLRKNCSQESLENWMA